MACLQNVQLDFEFGYNSVDTLNSTTSGTIDITIGNIGSNVVDGILTVNADSYSFNTSSYSVSILLDYPPNLPNSYFQNFDIKLVIDNCVYKARITREIFAQSDNNVVNASLILQGFTAVYGCTDASFYEYNSNANVDDGSCETLIPIDGCTNELALNYNPSATRNDGSCIFVEGCTNDLASNYNSMAVADDGSCVCTEAFYEIQPLNESGSPFVIEQGCDYIMEFDMLVELNCFELLKYVDAISGTVIDAFEGLGYNFITSKAVNEDEDVLFTGGTLDISEADFSQVQLENLWNFNYDDDSFNLSLKGDFCDDLLELLSKEDCERVDINKFTKWNTYQVRIPNGLDQKYLKYAINLSGFSFPFELFFDNIKFYAVCEKIEKDCKLIPKQYGFDFNKHIDNIKSKVREGDEIDFFNTKDLEFSVNPSKYITNDVKKYFDSYASQFNHVREYNDITNNQIDVNNHLYHQTYPYLNYLYLSYYNSDQAKCYPSKGLDYTFNFEIFCNLPKEWFQTVQKFIPATSLWDGAKYKLKNHQYDRNKFDYRKHGVEIGNCTSGTIMDCELVSVECLNETQTIQEQFSDAVNIFCFSSGNTVCETVSSENGTIGGRLIKYEVDFNGDKFVSNYYGFDNYECLTGSTESPVEPVRGCTNPEADNYNPNANFDDGSCIFCDEEIIMGCTYPQANNYNSNVNFDDGSCVFEANGNISQCEGVRDSFNLEVTITREFDSIFNINVRLTSTSYTGNLIGSYKLYNFKNDDFTSLRPLRYNTGGNLNLSNYIEFGFNEFLVTPNSSSSPVIVTVDDSTVVGQNAIIDFTILTDNDCLYKAEITSSDGLIFPSEGSSNVQIIIT